jgi:hypothetical protein
VSAKKLISKCLAIKRDDFVDFDDLGDFADSIISDKTEKAKKVRGVLNSSRVESSVFAQQAFTGRYQVLVFDKNHTNKTKRRKKNKSKTNKFKSV